MIQPRLTLLLILAVFTTSTRQYELGTTYKYTYKAAVLLNEPPPLTPSNSTKAKGTDVGYQVASQLEVTNVWQDPSDSTHILLEILMKSPSLSIRSRKAQTPDGFSDHSSPLNDLKDTAPVYLDWSDGLVSHFYSPDSESPSVVNMKKGVASLFQVQSSNVKLDELDTSGSCKASYKVLDGRTLLKQKSNCKVQKSVSSTYARSQKILGASTTSNYQTKYNLKLDSNVVETLLSTEVQSLRINLRSQAGASVISRQFLQLDDVVKAGKKLSASSVDKAIESATQTSGINYVQDNLQLTEEPIFCDSEPCKPLKDSVNELKKRLQSSQLATSPAAQAFNILVSVVRRSTKADVVSVLKDSKNKDIVPQLLDVIAAAQTAESHAAAVESINFKNDKAIELPERYLMAVSLSTHPSEYLLKDLMILSKKITNAKLVETALLSLAAVTKTFASNPENAASPVVAEVQQYFLNKMKDCSKENCLLFLRVLKNLGSADTLPIILSHIDNKDKQTSVTAIKALRALPAHVFSHEKVKQKLLNVFFQFGRRYDSSARTLALDALLEHQPNKELLLNLLTSLSARKPADSELATYTLQRLTEFAGNDPVIRSQLKEILASHPSINNYDIFSQNGLSTAFSRSMYRGLSSNGTFSSSTEAASGMMKRSSFDVFLRNEQDSFQALSFGLFASGLGSMMGSSGDDDDQDEATAGMEITLSGIQLRPFIFFTGQGELMGHVWSGTASERTSALKGTILLQDHRQIVPLQSGFLAVLNVLGSVSFDFGGEIQISVWNRNSHSVVGIVAAWELGGSLNLATPFVKSQVDFTVGAKTNIDFVSDVSFTDGLLACLRMGQSKFNLDYTTQKRESIPGTKHYVHKRKKRQDVVEGRSYALNDKNTVLCNQMFANGF